MSEELYKYHYHEFIDRTDCVRRMIDQLLEEHPVAMAHPELAACLNGVQVLLGNAYQAAGLEGG